ncbi:MAG: NAD-dependent epimerase/dehydratase family protein, partial [Gammaproteobacteria bacterium]
HEIVGIDNLNNYYSIELKKDRLNNLSSYKNFTFIESDISDFLSLEKIFKNENISMVINLAAQAGVRYSIENPNAYINSNVQGFMNILEACRNQSIKHLVYASSSSVYGGNTNLPFSEDQNVDHPVSIYAATKKSNELMAHSYSHLFNLPTTGLRFFTVYGPWGRPDMALFLFTKAIIENKTIDVYNHGNMVRDFTYIDDIVNGIVSVLFKPAEPSSNYDSKNPNPSISSSPYRIFNIGNNRPVQLLDYISAIENVVGIESKKNFLPIQPGDVIETSATTNKLYQWVNFHPETSIEFGIEKFVNWYREYFKC